MKASRPLCTRTKQSGETVTVLENATLNHIVFTYESYDREGHKTIVIPDESTGPFSFDEKYIHTYDDIFKVNGTLDFETKQQ